MWVVGDDEVEGERDGVRTKLLEGYLELGEFVEEKEVEGAGSVDDGPGPDGVVGEALDGAAAVEYLPTKPCCANC